MIPLMGGTHLLIGRKDRSLGILAAAVPAIISGVTCPMPKLARSKIPAMGLPECAIQANKTAKTGVVQGEAARPNANPADIGASGAGTFLIHIEGSGPVWN